MGNEVVSGVLAIGSGIAIGVLLFVPFVALSYRRRGSLTFGRSLLWIAAAVYFCAIWTYTLFPLPDPDALVCIAANTDVWQAVRDVQGARERGHAFTDPATLQLALNVLLFVPLGALVRVLGSRGLPTAIAVGVAVSLFIETTQATGMWWIYECSYRVFDVDDLLANTAGAVVGSIVGICVPQRARGVARLPDSDEARPVTKPRRLIGALCDVLAAALVSAAISVVVQLWLEYVADDHEAVLDGAFASTIGAAVPAIIWLVVIAASGQSVGDLCVELEYRAEHRKGLLSTAFVRVARFVGGIGMFYALTLLPDPFGASAWVFAGGAIVALLVTPNGHGLTGLVSGSVLVDARGEVSADVSGADDEKSGG
ncbi:VanZ family protein [Gordonia sp. (in: high G+C Gram-positive bacteria)]|uniref:VanZ family protein n=1 Tax=Gordonia sp. (in: high G+C Gram-positive bacteria) TaxID=84139 RepID=UPI003F992432